MKKILLIIALISSFAAYSQTALELPYGVKVVTDDAADWKRGPWANAAAAKTNVPITLRQAGLVVFLLDCNCEYIWLDGDLTDSGLVPHTAAAPTLQTVLDAGSTASTTNDIEIESDTHIRNIVTGTYNVFGELFSDGSGHFAQMKVTNGTAKSRVLVEPYQVQAHVHNSGSEATDSTNFYMQGEQIGFEVTKGATQGRFIITEEAANLAIDNGTGRMVQLNLKDSAMNVISTYSSFGGIKYDDDYSANFTAHSLIDLKYFNDHSGGGGGGSGTVNTGTAGEVAVYTGSTTVDGTTDLPNGTTATTQSIGNKTDSIATTKFVRRNSVNVYNVEAYGAKHDLQTNSTASITSGTDALTCSGCTFTSGDVGKSIRVYGAGASGVDLLTTIDGFTNSTTISIATNASTSITTKQIEWGTDDTPGIQATINAAFTAGGGTVYLPNGVYGIFGALVTSLNSINPNCQIYIPLRTGSTFPNRLEIIIRGESIAPFPSGPYGGQSTHMALNGKGVVIRSMITGSGTLPTVWGSSYETGGFADANYTHVIFDNIYTYTKSIQGTTHVAPTMSAWRVNYLISKEIRNCVADTESVGSLSVLPVAETYGFYLSTNGLADNVSNYHNTSASNYYYGFRMEEHGSWDKLTAFTCISGLYITGSRAHPIVGGGSFLNQWCQYGITFAGSKYVDINYYAERWDTGGNPSKWFDKIADIYFPSTQAVDGIIKGVATRANDPTEEPIVISGVYTGNLQINDIASNGTKIKMATSEYSEIQNTNSAGSLNSYKQNDRGSFASYFGTLYGGSASVGTLFGLGYADRMFLFTGGASNLGMAIGTISSQPLVFGTDNTERFRIGPAGQWGLSGANYGTSGQFLQTTGSGGAPVWAAPFTLTTTGTSGAATYTGGTLNIPQYTGGGGGITNGAASNELMKSDGTNAVASGLSSSTAGDVNLGLSGTSGATRTIQAAGSATDVGISMLAKGAGTITIRTNDASNGVNIEGDGGLSFIRTQTSTSIIGGTTTGTADVNNALKVRHDITGTPTAGSGAGIELESETSSSNYEVGATIEAVTTDVTSTSEDFDLVLKTMTAGAAATEKLRVTSTGNVYVKHGAGSFQLNGLVESVVLAGTSLTLDDDTHRGKVIYCTSGSAVTITVPSGLPLGFTCTIIQDGGGTVSLSASGTTLHGKVASTAQYDAITINYYKSSETYIGF